LKYIHVAVIVLLLEIYPHHNLR